MVFSEENSSLLDKTQLCDSRQGLLKQRNSPTQYSLPPNVVIPLVLRLDFSALQILVR